MSYSVECNFHFTDNARAKIGEKQFHILQRPTSAFTPPSFGDLVAFSGFGPLLFQVAARKFTYQPDGVQIDCYLEIETDIPTAPFKLIDGGLKNG